VRDKKETELRKTQETAEIAKRLLRDSLKKVYRVTIKVQSNCDWKVVLHICRAHHLFNTSQAS